MTERHFDGGGWEQEAGYARAVRRGGRIIVSGTTATGPDGGAIDGGTGDQTRQALGAALAAVVALGGTIDDVVRTRVYLAPGADWREAAAAHREVLGGVSPANTMVYVHGLIGDGFSVEVEMEAEVIG